MLESSHSTSAISENKAIAIAATQLPLKVVERSTVEADQISGWRVVFQNADTTREELDWPQDGKSGFQPEGSANMPLGVFRTVLVDVNPLTADVNSRLATNSIILGQVRPITKMTR